MSESVSPGNRIAITIPQTKPNRIENKARLWLLSGANEANHPVNNFQEVNSMGPDSGLKIVLVGLSVTVLLWVTGVRGIRKVFQESENGYQDNSDLGMRISLFAFKVVMLLLLVFVLWLGLLVSSMRS